ncbi:MAG: putative nucleotide binding protein [Nitrososphaeraceae archaeon]|nr:putative nucleotide binding protein [Nitrososphaeraceae archaeon]
MNRKYGAIELLIDSDRLKILEPDKECLRQVIIMAKKTGDYEKLSTADVSILALAFQLNAEYCCHFKNSSRDYWN